MWNTIGCTPTAHYRQESPHQTWERGAVTRTRASPARPSISKSLHGCGERGRSLKMRPSKLCRQCWLLSSETLGYWRTKFQIYPYFNGFKIWNWSLNLNNCFFFKLSYFKQFTFVNLFKWKVLSDLAFLMKFSCKYIKDFKDLQWENIKYLIKNIHYMTTIFWTLWDNKNIKNKRWRYS